MIEGLKATVRGDELKRIILDRANKYRDEAKAACVQRAKLQSAGADDAREKHDEKYKLHLAKSREWLAAHIVTDETYLLDRGDMVLIGIEEDEYGF